jgi:hypothetical protein
MTAHVTSSHRRRFSLPEEPGRRAATESMLMVAATMAATVVAWIMGTIIGSAVFDLEEQELLTTAGAWGYIVALLLTALMVIPATIGVALGVRARRLGERRLGTTGIAVNAVIAVYLVVTLAGTLLFG